MKFLEEGLTHEIQTTKPEAEIVPELTYPEVLDLPVTGWPKTREELVLRGSELLDALVRTVTREQVPERKLLGEKAAGRGGFLEPFVFKVRDGLSTFTNLYFKGIGITSVRAALTPVADEWRKRELLQKWQAKTPIFEPLENEVLGMTIIDDAKQDGEKSLEMHELGIRTRLPVVCFKLLAVPQNGSMVNLEELVAKGWPIKLDEKNWPVVSVWARRNPFTFADVTWALNEATAQGKGEEVARRTIDQLFYYLQFEEDQEGRKIAAEYWKARSREPKIAAGKTLQKIKFTQIENKWISWVAKMYGTEMKKMRENGILHGMLSGQNCSVGVEFSDNSNAEFWNLDESNLQSFTTSHDREVERLIESIVTLKFALENAQGKVFKINTEEKLKKAFYSSYSAGKKPGF